MIWRKGRRKGRRVTMEKVKGRRARVEWVY